MAAFFPEKNVVLACLFTGIYDVNRSHTLPADDFSLVQDWAESLAAHSVQGIIFYNQFSEATCKRYQHPQLVFLRQDCPPGFNPNVYRYLVYHDFLRNYAETIQQVFVTDVSDVVAVQNPFVQPLFLAHPEALFCGDEPKTLHNDWMRAHGEYLRARVPGYAHFEDTFAHAPLLNCGIIGGNMQVMLPFLESLSQLHSHYNRNNPTAYTGDMGMFNYLVRTRYNDRVRYGAPVNTVFKAYETDRTDCWFRHK
jgi:hypothetical protein